MSSTKARTSSYLNACDEHLQDTTQQLKDKLNNVEKESPSVTTDLSRWMTNLSEPLTKIPINRLAIPGSHDSGAYYLDPDTPISPGQSKFVKKHGRYFKSIIINWSLTQKYDITEQLRNGVRYFDMRAGYLDLKDDFLFVHGIYGHSILDLLKHMQTFLISNPREVVIIDFNHFYSFDDVLHHRFVSSILTLFDDMIFTKDHGGGATSSLSDFWWLKKQVVIRYATDTISVNYKELWPNSSISSPWFNCDSATVLIGELNNNFTELKDNKFNIFQAVLTPRPKTVALNTISSLRKHLVTKCNIAVKSWLNEVHEKRQQGVNVVICDFVCEDQCVAEILKLNEIIVH